MANIGYEVGSSAIGQGFLDRGQKAYALGAAVVFPAQDGKVTRTAKDAWVTGTQKTVALPTTRLIRPVYGVPLFGAGQLATGATKETVGTNAATATGPTTGQQWPRGVKVGQEASSDARAGWSARISTGSSGCSAFHWATATACSSDSTGISGAVFSVLVMHTP